MRRFRTPRWSAAAAALACALLAGSAAAQGVAAGSFHYTDRLYDSTGFNGLIVRPVREADVELYDANTMEIVGVGATGRDGSFAIAMTGGAVRDLGVRVLASTERTPSLLFNVVDDGAMDAVYAYSQPGSELADVDPAENADFGAITMPSSIGDLATADPSSMAFNLFDDAVIMSDWIASVEGERPTTPFSVAWAPEGGRPGSFYSPPAKRLFMADRDAYNDPVALHELGHYVDDHYGELDDTGGPHFIGDDSQDARLSWGEGLATLFCNAALLFHGRPSPELYSDRDGFAEDGMGGGFSYSLETISSGGGSTNEAKVNAALYDLIDGADAADATPGVDDDALSGLVANVWAVVRELRARDTVHAQMEDFGDLWFELGFGMEAPFRAVLGAHRIEFFPDLFEPNDHPEDAALLNVGAAFSLATFYKTGERSGGDEDWYRFAATEGTWYLVEVNAQPGSIFGRPDPEMFVVDMELVAPIAGSDDPYDGNLNSPFSSSAQRMGETAPSILFRAAATREHHVLLRHASRERNVNGRHGTYALRVRSIAAPDPRATQASAQRMLPGESYPIFVRGAELGVGGALECDSPDVSFSSTIWLAPSMVASTVHVAPGAAPGVFEVRYRNVDGVAGAGDADGLAIAADAQPPVAIAEIDVEESSRVEIANLGSVPATLTGWTLRTRSPDQAVADFPFPDGFQLAAGARVVLSDAPGTNSATELFDNLDAVAWSWIPEFTGDASLVDDNGANVDFLRFVFSYVTVHELPQGTGGLWGQPEIQAPPPGFSLSRSDVGALYRTTRGLAPAMPTIGEANATDAFEDNDEPRGAPVFALGPQFDNLAISPRPNGEDVDWFGFVVPDAGGARFDLIFDAGQGELAMAIYPPGAEEGDQAVAIGQTTGEGLAALIQVAHAAVGGGGVYRVRVSGVNGATNGYSLRAERWPVGDAPSGWAFN